MIPLMTVQSPAGEAAPAAPPAPDTERVPLIELLNVSKSFATGNQSPVTILDRVNLQVSEGRNAGSAGPIGLGQIDHSAAHVRGWRNPRVGRCIIMARCSTA